MKTCSKCGEDKSFDLFSPAKNSKDGRSSWCKLCKKLLEDERRRARGCPVKKVPSVANDREKECLICNTVKLLDDFDLNARGRQGRRSYCKECALEYVRLPKFREGRRVATQAYRDSDREWWRFLHRCHMQARRARLVRAETGLVTREFLASLYEQTECNYCHKETPVDQRTCDHVIPLIAGGLHHPDNLVMACGSCNSSKRDRDLAVFLNDRSRMQ